ncbi:MAG: metal-dependent hydrolase [Candidatus Bathyarchaeota archaeon]|nr:metal-dependent hydrolase [Candidatus Bathyarchaeota archaeon]
MGLKEDTASFAVGHMAIAYLIGKGFERLLHVKVNIPLLLVLSILPDIDIIFDFFSGTEMHRGFTHSLFFAILVFAPFFMIYGRKVLAYFFALLSHSLIGDFFIGGGLQLLWPLTTTFGFNETLGGRYISIFNPINTTLELILFAVATYVLYRAKDWKAFLSGDKTSLVLIIPVATVLLPTTIGYPFSQSLLLSDMWFIRFLAIAHLFYLVLFSIAIFKALIALVHDKRQLIPQRKPLHGR